MCGRAIPSVSLRYKLPQGKSLRKEEGVKSVEKEPIIASARIEFPDGKNLDKKTEEIEKELEVLKEKIKAFETAASS